MSDNRLALIRNFSIIAHVDHGKTTLSDRLIQYCGGLSERDMKELVLDSLDVERERGITVKAQSVTLYFDSEDGNRYTLNFIDTPGHVDFSYEVSRSLYACEGALLIVDAAQGVEAQSVANCYKALEQNLTILPVLNKIDLPQAEPDRVRQEIEDVIGLDASESCEVSAKTGVGVKELLEKLVIVIPPTTGNEEAPLQALIIDSWFDSYLGVVVLVRVKAGKIKKGDRIFIKSNKQNYRVDRVGIFTPNRLEIDGLFAGDVGYITAGIKDIYGAPVGDTIVEQSYTETESIPGFEKVKPVVYAALFPTFSEDFENFREALERLKINDPALTYEPESSEALGSGFRCGFLGLLHMEIVQERLENEYNISLITTAPTVVYEIIGKKGESLLISNPSELPDLNKIDAIKEPVAMVNILVPHEYLGKVMTLCIERRGQQKSLVYAVNQVAISFQIPMIEVIIDFFDKLKSITRGYGSCDFSLTHYETAPMVKVDILINGSRVDALAMIIHRDRARRHGILLVERMQEIIPRQMFEVAIQAAIGNQVIARKTVKALRKNVLAKCYGGDVSRKRKLLEKQKAGKKRMKQVGNVEVPQEAFLAVLNLDKD